MWPQYLDHSKDECVAILRKMELTAYSSVIDALRASGDLTDKKRGVLNSLASILAIPVERHKAEIRRAINDELLGTVAFRVIGADNCQSWMIESRRIIPILPRAKPVTALSKLADTTKQNIDKKNAQLVPPSLTTKLPCPPALPDPELDVPPSPPRSPHPGPKKENNGTASPQIDVESPSDVSQPAKSESLSDGGFVVLPSGMAVRLKEELQPSVDNKRGKRKRSSSKAIEVFPDGLPQKQSTSPARKVPHTTEGPIQQAGHAYARPYPPSPQATATTQPNSSPSKPSLVQPTSTSQEHHLTTTSVPSSLLQRTLSGEQLVAPSPIKRLVGRPAAPISPMPAAGTVYQTTRGRPRLNSASSLTPRVRAVRPRGPRIRNITPRFSAPLANASTNLLHTQAAISMPINLSQPTVRGLGIPSSIRTQPPILTPRPRQPISVVLPTSSTPQSPMLSLTTTPALHGPISSNLPSHNSHLTSSSLQGLKVISHTTTKIVPKSTGPVSGAVYVVPRQQQLPSSSTSRFVTVNTPIRLSRPRSQVETPLGTSNATTGGPIRTQRITASGKPSVIVVQKGASLATTSSDNAPAVALYRPSRTTTSGQRFSAISTSNGVVRLATPQRHPPQSSNVIVLDLTQEQLQQSNLASMIPQGHVVISNNAAKNHVMGGQSGRVIISDGQSINRGSSHAVLSEGGNSTNITDSSAGNVSLARKIFTHTSVASTPSRDDVWLRMESEDRDEGKYVPISTSVAESGSERLNMTPPSNYSDIFSAALEQANISLDSTNLIVEHPSSHNTITTLAGRSVTTTSGSRLVTLPHRPAYTKPQLAKQVPLYGPPEVVMPRGSTPVNVPQGDTDSSSETQQQQQQGSFAGPQETAQQRGGSFPSQHRATFLGVQVPRQQQHLPFPTVQETIGQISGVQESGEQHAVFEGMKERGSFLPTEDGQQRVLYGGAPESSQQRGAFVSVQESGQKRGSFVSSQEGGQQRPSFSGMQQSGQQRGAFSGVQETGQSETLEDISAFLTNSNSTATTHS